LSKFSTWRTQHVTSVFALGLLVNISYRTSVSLHRRHRCCRDLSSCRDLFGLVQ